VVMKAVVAGIGCLGIVAVLMMKKNTLKSEVGVPPFLYISKISISLFLHHYGLTAEAQNWYALLIRAVQPCEIRWRGRCKARPAMYREIFGDPPPVTPARIPTP
jgi:cell division protein FtsW (lipid II flippase)